MLSKAPGPRRRWAGRRQDPPIHIQQGARSRKEVGGTRAGPANTYSARREVPEGGGRDEGRARQSALSKARGPGRRRAGRRQGPRAHAQEVGGAAALKVLGARALRAPCASPQLFCGVLFLSVWRVWSAWGRSLPPRQCDRTSGGSAACAGRGRRREAVRTQLELDMAEKQSHRRTLHWEAEAGGGRVTLNVQVDINIPCSKQDKLYSNELLKNCKSCNCHKNYRCWASNLRP
ncbi:uncharacterized protein [Dipodomys merriami]|uniref:uncharacterized protein n=1 Tax=Dipodomys merriami TaxID=94247 RepID=UPI003855FAAA